MDSERECPLQMVERFCLPEELRVELDYLNKMKNKKLGAAERGSFFNHGDI